METDDNEKLSKHPSPPNTPSTVKRIRICQDEINKTLETSSTPVINNSSGSENERSFIRQLEWDCVNGERYTSTPVHRIPPRFYNSLPNHQPSSGMFGRSRSINWPTDSPKTETDPELILYKYVNPFTEDGRSLLNRTNTQQRLRSLNLDSALNSSITYSRSDSVSFIPERNRLNELNVSRFNEEFVDLEMIGKGDHGVVFKCINRINGCIYAVKKTIKPITSGFDERTIQNEIYAHGVLDHINIVRNYSCWKEEGFVFIQNEYCNGGNLEDHLKKNVMTESQLFSLLLQIGYALSHIHSKGLVHMDVKPGNIFLCIVNNNEVINNNELGNPDTSDCEIVFKLGDFGHVAKMDETHYIDEGDCRYYPREILEDNLEHLDRADIFSLGLTVYEAAGGGPLPKNGDQWHDIRNGNLIYLYQHTKQLNDVLKSMIDVNPQKRPPADDLILKIIHICQSPFYELFGGLKKYQKNSTLLKQKELTSGRYQKFLSQIQQQFLQFRGKDKQMRISKKTVSVLKNRNFGKRLKRSKSTTF